MVIHLTWKEPVGRYAIRTWKERCQIHTLYFDICFVHQLFLLRTLYRIITCCNLKYLCFYALLSFEKKFARLFWYFVNETVRKKLKPTGN